MLFHSQPKLIETRRKKQSLPAVTIPALVAVAAPDDCKSVTHIHARPYPGDRRHSCAG